MAIHPICFYIVLLLGILSCRTTSDFSKTKQSASLSSEQFLRYKKAYLARYERSKGSYPYDYYEFLNKIPHSKSKVSSWTELEGVIGRISVILMGDHHDIKKSQDNTIKILQTMNPKKHQITFVSEWVNKQDEKYLNQFMASEISDSTFLQKINFRKNWHASSLNFLDILKFCRENRIRAIAVDHRGGAYPPIRHNELAVRDELIANRVVDDSKKHPESKYLIVFGSSHLLGIKSKHIYRKLADMDMKPDLVIVPTKNHFYFTELEKTLDDSKLEVISYRDDIYYLSVGLLEDLL
jgi:uncharacterized iron-regulated protein